MNNQICPECGCPFPATRKACPECGCPNHVAPSSADSREYATECSSCGAPSNGSKVCQWCGSTIQSIGTGNNHSGSNNKTI